MPLPASAASISPTLSLFSPAILWPRISQRQDSRLLLCSLAEVEQQGFPPGGPSACLCPASPRFSEPWGRQSPHGHPFPPFLSLPDCCPRLSLQHPWGTPDPIPGGLGVVGWRRGRRRGAQGPPQGWGSACWYGGAAGRGRCGRVGHVGGQRPPEALSPSRCPSPCATSQ